MIRLTEFLRSITSPSRFWQSDISPIKYLAVNLLAVSMILSISISAESLGRMIVQSIIVLVSANIACLLFYAFVRFYFAYQRLFISIWPYLGDQVLEESPTTDDTIRVVSFLSGYLYPLIVIAVAYLYFPAGMINYIIVSVCLLLCILMAVKSAAESLRLVGLSTMGVNFAIIYTFFPAIVMIYIVFSIAVWGKH